MNGTKGLMRLFFLLTLCLGLVATLSADQAVDVVTLKDGRVIQGHIVDESETKVDVEMGGVARTFGRDFIAKISYGGAGGDSVPVAAPAPASAPANAALTAELADEYQVPQSSVVWVRRQGISDADLPEVLQVAAEARVSLGEVVQARLQGRSWDDIRSHYGLGDYAPEPRRVVVVDPVAAVVEPLLVFRILLFPFFLFGHWR